MSLVLPGDSHSAKTLNTLVNLSTFCLLAAGGENSYFQVKWIHVYHWSKKLKYDPSEWICEASEPLAECAPQLSPLCPPSLACFCRFLCVTVETLPLGPHWPKHRFSQKHYTRSQIHQQWKFRGSSGYQPGAVKSLSGEGPSVSRSGLFKVRLARG